MAPSLLALALLCVVGTCAASEGICSGGAESCSSTEADSQVALQIGVSMHAQPDTASQEAAGHTSARVVVMTYCDAGFAAIWPTFTKCYELALGCSPDVTGANSCGPLQLMDLAMESIQPGQAAKHCVRTRAPSLPKSLSLDEQGLTPSSVPLLIANGIADQLTQGRDVLHLDADVFLLSDPMQLLQEEFQHADVISSVDCAKQGAYCNWYFDDAFKKRHNSTDPLEDMGFMPNTGFIYLRSNPKTISIARATAKALQSGRSTYEQTAFAEELADRNCRWTTGHGDMRMPAPGGRASFELLSGQKFFGTCDGGLQVVVLPYRTVTRSMPIPLGALAMHPGGDTPEKINMLPHISDICVKLAADRAEKAGSSPKA